MLKDITLGQYFPGNSVIHRMDPRAKLIVAILYIVAIFCAQNIIGFAALLAVSFLLILLSRISIITILRGLKPILFVLVFTALINIFWMEGETLLVSFGFIHIYLEGIINAILIAVRIIILLAGTTILMTFTTTPIALTDGLEQLLSPLMKIGIPVHEFSMMMTIALRFIPTLTEETQKIMNAQ